MLHSKTTRGRAIRSALLWVGCAALYAADDDPVVTQHPGTVRMSRRLEVIADSSSPWANPYLNDRAAELLASLPTPPDAGSRLALEQRIAFEMLLAGRGEEAVSRLRELGRIHGAERFRPLMAIALLRLGEQQNCISRHTADSCLMPIRDAGVYTEQQATREAIVVLTAMLDADPDDLTSRWFLNLAYMTVGEYPEGLSPRWLIPPTAFESEYDIGRFHDVATGAGLAALGLAGGAVVEDFDGDGDLDAMTSSSGLTDQLRYFSNQGDGRFVERTREAGLTGIVGGLNLVHADYDNDSHPDLLVLRGAWLGVKPATDGGHHPNSLLRNRGDGTFEDVTDTAGLLDYLPTQTAAWADYDADGWLDLFVGYESFGHEINPSRLYRNNGDGTFTDRAIESGVAVVGLVKGVAWGDYDNDGRPDLYVSRLGAPNLLFHNDGKTADAPVKFHDVTATAGVAEPRASFPTWFWDYDNDGWLDLFVSGYATDRGQQAADVLAELLGQPTAAERPRLYRNNGDGSFTDVTRAARLDRVAFTMGCNFGDLDNDGWLDTYLGTGDPDLRALVPNRVFRNDGHGSFEEVTTSGGFGHVQKGHGVAFADLDDDGDQDIYMNVGGFYSGDVYQNVLFENPGHGNRWIRLQLEGTQANRSAIGARIKVTISSGEARREIHVVVGSGGSFGSSPLRQEIGLGKADAVESVEIVWPGSQAREIHHGLSLDRSYRLREGDPKAHSLKLKTVSLGGG